MKPLSQMTREELWALDACDIWELYYTHYKIAEEDSPLIAVEVIEILESLRLELQQAAAEARRESLEDR